MLETQKFAVFQLFYMCDTLINISVSITLKYRSNSSRINRWKMHKFYSKYADRQECYFFYIKSTTVLHTWLDTLNANLLMECNIIFICGIAEAASQSVISF